MCSKMWEGVFRSFVTSLRSDARTSSSPSPSWDRTNVNCGKTSISRRFPVASPEPKWRRKMSTAFEQHKLYMCVTLEQKKRSEIYMRVHEEEGKMRKKKIELGKSRWVCNDKKKHLSTASRPIVWITMTFVLAGRFPWEPKKPNNTALQEPTANEGKIEPSHAAKRRKKYCKKKKSQPGAKLKLSMAFKWHKLYMCCEITQKKMLIKTPIFLEWVRIDTQEKSNYIEHKAIFMNLRSIGQKTVHFRR